MLLITRVNYLSTVLCQLFLLLVFVSTYVLTLEATIVLTSEATIGLTSVLTSVVSTTSIVLTFC